MPRLHLVEMSAPYLLRQAQQRKLEVLQGIA